MIDDMAVYIANLGKYNEGYLVGAWFTFPIDEEDVKEKIGLNEQYEEYAIHDTDNFPIAIGEYVSIEELNEMYEMIEELPDYIVECLDEFISHYGTLEEVMEHKDDIYVCPSVENIPDSEILDSKGVRLLTKMSDRTLLRRRNDGTLPFYRDKGKIYYRRSDVLRAVLLEKTENSKK